MHKIKLLNLNFPNGEHRKATLVPFGTIDWHLAKTGKGTTQVNYSQLKQGAFSSPAVSNLTTLRRWRKPCLWGGLQHPQSTVTSALNNRFWCPQCYYNLKQLKLLKELSSPH